MAFLEKPKGYWHWFKQAVRMCFPMEQDFQGLGHALWEASCELASSLAYCVVRLFFLLTFPISVPLLSFIFTKVNKKTMERRAEYLSEECDGFPPQYTREEVDSVLSGEKTLEQLEKEKEAKWNS